MGRGKVINLTVDGKVYTLRAWAIANNANPFTLLRRWHSGITDPYELLKVRSYGRNEKGRTPEELAPEEIVHLREVAYASTGQADHWEILCDLAGVAHIHKERLKEVMYDGKG